MCLKQEKENSKIKKEGKKEKQVFGLSVMEQSFTKSAQRECMEPLVSCPTLIICLALFN